MHDRKRLSDSMADAAPVLDPFLRFTDPCHDVVAFYASTPTSAPIMVPWTHDAILPHPSRLARPY
jgi:hypothetical protein